MSAPRILIIKHGALGDMVLATGPMQAIRNHHPDAYIVLLTSQAFAGFMKGAPFIDDIWVDEKPKAWQFRKLARLGRMLNSPHFDFVYDLQTSQRSTGYFKLFRSPVPQVSGLAKGASHRHHTPERTSLHTIDRQKQQLAIAGIDEVPAPNLDWLGENIELPLVNAGQQPFALLVAGGSAHRPAKRWPSAHYAALAQTLIAQDVIPVLIGAGAEAELLDTIAAADAGIINLCNKTSFAQLAALARHAVCAVGNDTGPMHIIAAAGCPSVVLFNRQESNPALCAPRGEHVAIIERNSLDSLAVEEVLEHVAPHCDASLNQQKRI